MRRVMRVEPNEAYWDRRWQEAGRDADRFEDLSVYPIRYAERAVRQAMAVREPAEPLRILELGAGLGRVLKHYHSQGFSISAIEKSDVAVAQLRSESAGLDVRHGDVRCLPFTGASFDVALAFGVFHNLEGGICEALAETARCLKPGGVFCISMRPDNLEMRLNEWYWRRNMRNGDGGNGHRLHFHKWLVTTAEFKELMARHGLFTREVHAATNVSMLYRMPALRARQQTETERRANGYRLNVAGRALNGVLKRLMPGQWANVLVFIGDRRAVPSKTIVQRTESRWILGRAERGMPTRHLAAASRPRDVSQP